MPHAVDTFAVSRQVYCGVDLVDPETSYEEAQQKAAETAAALKITLRRAVWRGYKRDWRRRQKKAK